MIRSCCIFLRFECHEPLYINRRNHCQCVLRGGRINFELRFVIGYVRTGSKRNRPKTGNDVNEKGCIRAYSENGLLSTHIYDMN